MRLFLLWSAQDSSRLYFALKVINYAYPFLQRLLCIIQNVYKTILWLNEKLMQHIECYSERFRQGCLTENFPLLHSFSTTCFPMVVQGHLACQSKFIGRNYLFFISGGTTAYINYQEKFNRSLQKSMTVCIASCGTGDISSSIVVEQGRQNLTSNTIQNVSRF